MGTGCICSLTEAVAAAIGKCKAGLSRQQVVSTATQDERAPGRLPGPRSYKYVPAHLDPESLPKATSGAGFISSSVFGVQENTAIADMAGDQGDVSFPGMMSICSTQARALESSAGLLMVSPFLPDRLRHSNWKLSEFKTRATLYSTNMSQVFHVTSNASGMHLAIKCYTTSALKEDKKIQAVREIWFHSRLSHPNIISMYAAWKEDGKICMALEYASGGSSFKRLRRVGRYREDVCAPRIILPVLCAVKFLHDLGLIHRDIKPENILLTDDGAKLADLGLVISHRDEPPNSCLGTFDYMAPELFELPHKAHPMQFKADPGVQACDSKLDVWAVGVLTYEMLVGRAPFVGDASADTVRQISSGFKGHFPATPPLSHRAKHFIKACLRHCASARPTVERLLQHAWVVEHCRDATETARLVGERSQHHLSAGEGAWSDLLEGVDSDAARRVQQAQRF